MCAFPNFRPIRSPRAVWVEEQIRSKYTSSRILDVGFIGACQEPFLHLGFRKENANAKIVGVDINLDGLLKWKLPNSLAADGGYLPFKVGSFDVVLCLEVFEHLYCPIPFVKEFWRILRPDGFLVLTTPNAWSWWNFLRHWMIGSLHSRVQRQVYRHYLGDSDHKQFYDPLSLMNLLDDAGFETTQVITKNQAIPVLGKFIKKLGLLDWQFYPMSRVGGYICLTAKKAHSPKI
jgi:SAM-dependent methyltransferase